MSQNSSVSHVKKKISKIFNWTREENSEFCQSPAKRNEIQWLVTHTQKKNKQFFNWSQKKKKKLAKFVKWSWKKHLISLMGCLHGKKYAILSICHRKKIWKLFKWSQENITKIVNWSQEKMENFFQFLKKLWNFPNDHGKYCQSVAGKKS